ncbi:MAG: hypothetical protein HY874_07465 [Chloroflexi bacterium]|nr:hypothetical protein [Chloroflexota bacterium]
MRAIAAAILVLMTAAACGGAASRDAVTPSSTPAVTAILEGETFVAVRMLPAAALSAEQLEAAGTATTSDGGSISMARADTADAAPWELVSAAAEGWRVWRPKVVLDTLAAAGAGASLATVEQVDWPDACLGVAEPNQVCAQVITPGYRVVVERSGGRIEYHTSRVGGARPAPAPTPVS